ncbi:hypothetical protein LCGC14_1488140, partial [marine sediment metagenome]
MSNKTGIIYKAENIKTGKVYVGQTTVGLNNRMGRHLKYTVRYDHKFARALKKYGAEFWKWSVLQNNVTLQYLDELECFYIFILNSYKQGYNSTEGGDISPALYPEVQQKISKSHLGTKKPYMKDVNKRKRGIKLSEA